MANRRSLRQKPPLGAVPNFAHPLSQGLVGWWLFNEQGGIKANDISGRGNNGTLIGGPTWNNQSLSFDGTNDYVVTGNYATSNSSPMTWSVWVNPTATSNNTNGIIGYSTTSPERIALVSGHSGANTDKWAIYTPGSGYIFGSTHGLNQWYHLVMVFDGTNVSLYVNGVLDISPTAASYTAGTIPFAFGRFYYNLNGYYFPGSLDDVRVYNRALSAAEVQQLYETPFANIAMASRGNMFISGDTAAVTGTITSATQSDIIAGGKTLILTLTGDTWVASGATFDAQRQAIINGVTSAQSEAFGWNAIPKTQQSVAGVVRTSDTIVTITWDAFATYDISTVETITVTIPSSALTGGVAIVATPTFSITPVFARRAFVLDNGTRLTSGRIPYSTGSNGLGDNSGLTYSTTTGITAPGFISNGVVRLKGYTVATLPSGTQGDTAFVTDANATTFNSVVAGGGSNVVSVFHNGTNWVIQ